MNNLIDICEDEKLLKYFRLGDKIIIKEPPGRWSSGSGGTCPFFENIKFPYNAKIVKIDYDYNSRYTSFYDGTYGWDLSHMIKDGICDNLRLLREKKLKKLNEI